MSHGTDHSHHQRPDTSITRTYDRMRSQFKKAHTRLSYLTPTQIISKAKSEYFKFSAVNLIHPGKHCGVYHHNMLALAAK